MAATALFRKVFGLGILLAGFALPLAAQEQWAHIYAPAVKDGAGVYCDGIIPFSGGGFLGITTRYGSHPLYILRMDSHGNLLWAKQYMQHTALKDLLDNGDGTFTVSAFDFDTANYYQPGWDMLFTCDAGGNILWQNAYWNGPGSLGFIARGLDGDLFVLSQMDMSLKRLDGNGGPAKWNRFYAYEESTGFVATPDGGFLLLGYGENPTEPHCTKLIKVNSDGGVLWARGYESTSRESQPQVSPTSNGGFLMVEHNGVNLDDSALMRLDSLGNILWQERLIWPDIPSMTPAILFGAHECADGTILVWGRTGRTPEWNGYADKSFLAALDPSGKPLWCKIYDRQMVFSENSIMNAVEAPGGYLFSSCGRSYDGYPEPEGPSLTRVNMNGDPADGCTAISIQAAAEATAYTVIDLQLAIREWPPFDVEPVQLPPQTAMAIQDVVVCGDAFPGIMTATKLQNPFQIKLSGWNFEAGSRAFIDGVQVPKVSFKKADKKTGPTRLTLQGGSKLAKMLPKGQPVCITVVNPDGRACECFSFTR